MDKLTPLERELMLSVSALVDGSNKEIAALRDSLKTYDASATRGIERRLDEIERVQDSLSERMSNIEKQHTEAWKKLTALLQNWATHLTESEKRLSGYETGTRSLTEALKKLAK
ncbi:hypothetical protein [Phyllobacterium leguminum]|uniref:Uncharacterized protein n=1 Tax=Phyllobacterium leguminum TaxID=314237 RepID=A0A318SWF7_9HYPH|nr:hypothetical protein [Phyllobacterium leguminum]PYE84197.1 hypothetical protein C7477_1514 [Phyllobacterium leguminum]